MAASKYKQAGVDIEAGTTLIDVIKPFAKATSRPGADGSLGGFGGLFDLKEAGYNDPILVSSCDGVGTKLRVALTVDKHDTVGIDLVAMCVNDLVVQGAEPLFLLDYVATGRLDIAIVREIIAGVAQGCKLAGCTLMGGETAEMPGMYSMDDYDIAGFAVGVVERDQLITGETIKPGDVILGIASDGIHSNGYSLVRKIIKDVDAEYDAPAPFMLDVPLGEALLAPTKIYAKQLLPLIKEKKLKGLAHITGGGVTDNIPRVLPNTCAASIDLETWQLPPVFQWLSNAGEIDALEMLKTFNCGVGMAAIVDPSDAKEVCKHLQKTGERVFEIGNIVPRTENGKDISYENLKSWGA